MCSVQGPVGRHVIDRLVSATEVPARCRADDEVPRSRSENELGKLRNAIRVIRRQRKLMNGFVTEVFESLDSKWITVDMSIRESARGP